MKKLLQIVWLRWFLIFTMAFPLPILQSILDGSAVVADATCDPPYPPNPPETPEGPGCGTRGASMMSRRAGGSASWVSGGLGGSFCDCSDLESICSGTGGGSGPKGVPCPGGDSGLRLFDGTIVEQGSRLSRPGTGKGWSHSHSYSNDILTESGSEIETATGFRWQDTASRPACIGLDDDTNITIYFGNTNHRVFTYDGGSAESWTAPDDYNASLTKADSGDSTETYTLFEHDTNQVLVFHGLNTSVAQKHRGKIKECTTKQLVEDGKTGSTYSYSSKGYVDSVTTAEPQTNEASYTYYTTGIEADRLKLVEVKDDSGTVVSKTEYKYTGNYTLTWAQLRQLGGYGDLAQVKTSRLTSDGNWDDSYTQYRYHSIYADGRDHQMKLVLENDALERIMAAGDTAVDTHEEIIKAADSYDVNNSGNTIADYGHPPHGPITRTII